MYTKCVSTEKSQCVKFDIDREDDVKKTTFYKLEYRYLDDNKQNFEEADVELSIIKFHEFKKIDILKAFPLNYYSTITIERIKHLCDS